MEEGLLFCIHSNATSTRTDPLPEQEQLSQDRR